MPRGTLHEVEGLLSRNGSVLRLLVDGGGTWRLDAVGAAWRLAGRRMVVSGRRDDFDLLAVEDVSPI